jgi:predicted glycosyltransferase involved in capsule biosynthesis
MNYTFSCIILYRHNIQRWNNLKRVLEWINSFSGVEVILVEQDTHSKISHLSLPAKHIFTKSNMPFNRSWGFNVGLNNCNSDVVVFTDCDLIMEPEQFIKSLHLLNEYDMVSPYKSVVDLTYEESQSQMDKIFKIDRPGRGETDHQKINICGGITMFRKNSIFKISGWDENFIGWGGEDDFQAIKVTNFLKWHESPYKCYHLYHDRDVPDQKWYQRNLQLLQKFSKLNKEDIVKVIQNSNQKIGMKNKYDNF